MESFGELGSVVALQHHGIQIHQHVAHRPTVMTSLSDLVRDGVSRTRVAADPSHVRGGRGERFPSLGLSESRRIEDVGQPRKIITAAEMDRMSPQERADAVDASQVNDWNEVNPTFRDEILETARELGAQRRSDA